ncbi:Bowman-Birk type proteinase inhibitor C-II [Ziziphus jujuba]|uniref:Bowman-Birk type proteinase inhibitor C-II n=2 Tax=Ziziphus jujuba TaxID=326968 RepID=A0AC41YXN3_ZIZJJ|nr:Bowman-Birk type proteinase inhibitor C-II [Ziziphus jujuba]
MGLKNVAVLKVAMLVLLLAISTKAYARSADMLNLFKLSSKSGYEEKNRPGGQACCDTCLCRMSEPPQCSCEDIFVGQERCESCEQCMCTRSNPPKCRCVDVKEFCHPPCMSEVASMRINIQNNHVPTY